MATKICHLSPDDNQHRQNVEPFERLYRTSKARLRKRIREWNPQEDNALLEGVTTMCELPQSLMVVSPSQTVNWDVIAENVNQTSISILHRSPKQCKTRYETVVGPEAKLSQMVTRNSLKTAQLMLQEHNRHYTNMFLARFEQIRNLASRKTSQVLTKPPGSQKVGKQSLIFTEHGINYDSPQTAHAIALARLERIQLERRKVLAAQEAARIAELGLC